MRTPSISNIDKICSYTNKLLSEIPGLLKSACVIGTGTFDGSVVLVKDRDRNYKPHVIITRELIDNVEVAYMTDLDTDWSEGMNSNGIGIVNSALQVGQDENEKKLARSGKKSKDGEKVRKALGYSDLKEVVHSCVSFKGGIYGHSFVSDGKKTVSIESTSENEAIMKRIDPNKIAVRTNHGIGYKDIGYTEGVKYFSSVMRQKRSIEALKEANSPKDVAPALVKARLKDRHSVENPVRDTDEMSTTSQIVMDLTNLHLYLYLIPNKVVWKGIKNKLPKDYEPKIKISVLKYEDMEDDSPKIDIKKEDPK